MIKKRFISVLLLLCALNSYAELRTFYVARHGKRGSLQYQAVLKNVKDDKLMPEGIEQAEQLGKYMAKIGFNGTVLVSPYYRTLETATFACNQMPEMPMFLEPRFQEQTSVKDSSGKTHISKEGITKKEVKKLFPKIKVPKKMKFPWRYENEGQERMDKRIRELFDELIAGGNGDYFLVGHGGTLSSVIRVMNEKGADFPKHKVYNCALYSFTIDTETGKVVEAVDHTFNYLPKRLITDNLGIIPVPAEAKDEIQL